MNGERKFLIVSTDFTWHGFVLIVAIVNKRFVLRFPLAGCGSSVMLLIGNITHGAARLCCPSLFSVCSLLQRLYSLLVAQFERFSDEEKNRPLT